MSFDGQGPMNFFQLITDKTGISKEEKDILASFDEFHAEIIKAMKQSKFGVKT